MAELTDFEAESAAWTEGGLILFAKRHEGGTELWSLPSSGGPPVLHARLPTLCRRVTVAPNGSFLICEQSVDQSDIWLVENFDRDVTDR